MLFENQTLAIAAMKIGIFSTVSSKKVQLFQVLMDLEVLRVVKENKY